MRAPLPCNLAGPEAVRRGAARSQDSVISGHDRKATNGRAMRVPPPKESEPDRCRPARTRRKVPRC